MSFLEVRSTRPATWSERLLFGGYGSPEYYELAERYLRSMLLPTQHRMPELSEFLRDRSQPADDSERRTVERSIGGYAMQLPNDRMREGDWPVSTLDITSGAVHAMSECYRQRTVVQGRTYTVNLLFDYSDDAVDIRSELPWTGRVEFTAKSPIDRIRIRIPTWVDRSTMQFARTVGAATAGRRPGPTWTSTDFKRAKPVQSRFRFR